MQIFIYCNVTLHVSGVHRTHHQVLKSVPAASGTGHNIGTATSLQRGHIWPSWPNLNNTGKTRRRP